MKYLPSLNIRFNANSMLVLAVIGIMIKLFFSQGISEDGLSGPANAVIWGYGGSIIAIICLLFIVVAFYDKKTIKNMSEKPGLEWVKNLLNNNDDNNTLNTSPIIISIILFISILLWTILLNIKYYKQINQGRVSLSYLNTVYISTILLIFQIIVLFKLVYSLFSYNSTQIEEANKTNSKMKIFTYLLSLINLILIGTATIDLTYFSTDG